MQVETAFASGRDYGSSERMFARALQARRELEYPGFPEAPRPAQLQSRAVFPSVKVPVLSTTSVSIFSKRSSASAFLIRIPVVAPLPIPTMIDIGVASPKAQGQAMIRTETAVTSA